MITTKSKFFSLVTLNLSVYCKANSKEQCQSIGKVFSAKAFRNEAKSPFVMNGKIHAVTSKGGASSVYLNIMKIYLTSSRKNDEKRQQSIVDRVWKYYVTNTSHVI